jgi:antitoxin HicB
MIRYPVNLIEDCGKILVTFDDVPEAFTFGEDRKHALKKAKDALVSALSFYTEANKQFPKPSNPKKNQFLISIGYKANN